MMGKCGRVEGYSDCLGNTVYWDSGGINDKCDQVSVKNWVISPYAGCGKLYESGGLFSPNYQCKYNGGDTCTRDKKCSTW